MRAPGWVAKVVQNRVPLAGREGVFFAGLLRSWGQVLVGVAEVVGGAQLGGRGDEGVPRG